MKIPFPFEVMLAFGWLSIMLLAGIVLRARIKLIQHFLVPSCLIGGMIGFILINTGIIDIKVSVIETMVFHFFNISFISIGLTYKGDSKEKKSGRLEFLKGPGWMALIESLSIAMQALIGGLLVLVFNYFGYNLFKTFGFFAPLGFTEGPGQAISIGKVWEGMGFEHAATIGLTFAAVGYLFAFLVGVPLANWGIRKGLAEHAPAKLPDNVLRGFNKENEEKEIAGRLTMHSSNIDSLAFHMALVGLVYVLTYAFVHFVGGMLSAKMGSMLWGFFFFAGIMIALLVRWIMTLFGINHLIDPGVQRRVTGWSVDYLILGTVTAIQVTIVWKYFVPIAVICILSGVLTLIVIMYFGDRLPELNIERTAAIYGTCTGTVSSGLLLLRIVDPEFKTSTALELGLMSFLVAPVVLASMLLVSAPVLWGWSLEFTMLVFLGIFAGALVLLKVFKMWGKRVF